MPIIDGNVIPNLLDNITVTERLNNGELYGYKIKANDGYVLHDKGRDWKDINLDTMEETLKLGFTRGDAFEFYPYDFEVNPREFYAVPESEVPADQIFGGVTPPTATE